MFWPQGETSLWRAPPEAFQTIHYHPSLNDPWHSSNKIKPTTEVDFCMTSFLKYNFSPLWYRKHEQSQVGKSWQFAQRIRRPKMNFFYISSKYHIVKFHFRQAEWRKANQNMYQLISSHYSYVINQLKLPWNLAAAFNCRKPKTNMQKTISVRDFWRNPQAEGKQL